MIGLTSITFRNKNIDEIIAFAQESRVDGIEWGSDVHVLPGDIKTAITVAQKCKENGIKIFSYGSYFKLGMDMDFMPYLDSAVALKTQRIRIWAGTKGSGEISQSERNLLKEECRSIAQEAQKKNIEICFEYHRHTLTDTKESAYQLMKDVDMPNVFLYWQPNPDVSEEEKYAEIHLLLPYIKTVHFFQWTGANVRHLMSEGKEQWKAYIELLPAQDMPYLLEFTKDDDENNALSDIECMRELLKK